ncbi:MAG: prolyl oligopeptidase family serine peptidase [Pseudomonadota bacterium]|nr:prolyl oligopeptidase family serine peptidase [Pseudomonadota bacterium]
MTQSAISANPEPEPDLYHAVDDPYLWLEDVPGERALAWARERNAATEKQLQVQPGFDTERRRILEVLDSKIQIPYVTRRGRWFYNLWRDAENPRGLWRRTTLAEYRKPEPAWETVIDVDALGKAEGENWVWAGARSLGPEYRLCLVSLSRGGADARVVREFDTVAKRFVEGGFVLPEAKSDLTWIDADQVYVGTDFGAGSLTDSGYARVIKRWRRGQKLAEAQTVFEAEKTDVAAGVAVDRTPGFERTVFTRAVDFYHSRAFVLLGDALVPIPKPDDAEISFDRSHVLVTLRNDWQSGSAHWKGGSLLIGDAAAFLAGKPALTALFTPSATRSLSGFAVTKSTVLLNLLDNVASRLQAWHQPAGGGDWTHRDIDAPHPGTVSVTALYDPLLKEDPLAEDYLLNSADFLSPDALQLAHTGDDRRELLKTRPSFYDAAGMAVEQRFARSADGTRIPYFVVWPKVDGSAKAKANGDNPTLLYGYGGFEVSLTPWYSGITGREWTGRGGVFVLANIRGGGEFGPAWHQAAILAHKQKSYDDFAAVAKDLIDTRVTSRAHLAIQGGSNGGLLVGAVMLQHPELFKAVVCQVPLLDMKRYSKLLAGASWIAEYGNPDKPADWAFIKRYSPYQNVRPQAKLPTVLFTTSTRDDRVHPGHARKMAARMLAQGHRVLYWENIEGGHGGAADNGQRATMLALEYAFLWQQIGPQATT